MRRHTRKSPRGFAVAMTLRFAYDLTIAPCKLVWQWGKLPSFASGLRYADDND